MRCVSIFYKLRWYIISQRPFRCFLLWWFEIKLKELVNSTFLSFFFSFFLSFFLSFFFSVFFNYWLLNERSWQCYWYFFFSVYSLTIGHKRGCQFHLSFLFTLCILFFGQKRRVFVCSISPCFLYALSLFYVAYIPLGFDHCKGLEYRIRFEFHDKVLLFS